MKNDRIAQRTDVNDGSSVNGRTLTRGFEGECRHRDGSVNSAATGAGVALGFSSGRSGRDVIASVAEGTGGEAVCDGQACEHRSSALSTCGADGTCEHGFRRCRASLFAAGDDIGRRGASHGLFPSLGTPSPDITPSVSMAVLNVEVQPDHGQVMPLDSKENAERSHVLFGSLVLAQTKILRPVDRPIFECGGLFGFCQSALI